MPNGGHICIRFGVIARLVSRVVFLESNKSDNLLTSLVRPLLVGLPGRSVIRLELLLEEMTAAKRITLTYLKSKFLLRFRLKENTGTIPPTLLFA